MIVVLCVVTYKLLEGLGDRERPEEWAGWHACQLDLCGLALKTYLRSCPTADRRHRANLQRKSVQGAAQRKKWRSVASCGPMPLLAEGSLALAGVHRVV